MLWGQDSDGSYTSFYLLRQVPGAAAVNSVRVSPRGKFIASAVSDGTVSLWNADNVMMPPIVYKHESEAMLVAFNGDAVLVFVAKDGSMHSHTAPINESGGRVSERVHRLLSGLESSLSRRGSL